MCVWYGCKLFGRVASRREICLNASDCSNGMIVSRNELAIICQIDKVSKRDVVDEIVGINHLVDNLIISILSGDQYIKPQLAP
jgi:hypothetical protein